MSVIREQEVVGKNKNSVKSKKEKLMDWAEVGKNHSIDSLNHTF